VGRLPSELGPWERQDYLSKLHAGLIADDLVAVALRDPKLAPRIKAQRTRDGRERAAMRAYFEEGHPWPEEPVAYQPHLVVWAPSPEPTPDPFAPRVWRLGGWGPFPSKDEEEAEAPRTACRLRVVPAPIRFPPLDVEGRIETNQRGPRRRPIGRSPESLPVAKVEKAEARLKERWKRIRPGTRASGPLTYEAIAAHSGLKRDRVTQIEDLMQVGWDLRESHPDFPAKRGYVNLPTAEKAAQLLHLR
jgi:hypothetical protein